jgi:hypothetical protein
MVVVCLASERKHPLYPLTPARTVSRSFEKLACLIALLDRLPRVTVEMELCDLKVISARRATDALSWRDSGRQRYMSTKCLCVGAVAKCYSVCRQWLLDEKIAWATHMCGGAREQIRNQASPRAVSFLECRIVTVGYEVLIKHPPMSMSDNV